MNNTPERTHIHSIFPSLHLESTLNKEAIGNPIPNFETMVHNTIVDKQ